MSEAQTIFVVVVGLATLVAVIATTIITRTKYKGLTSVESDGWRREVTIPEKLVESVLRYYDEFNYNGSMLARYRLSRLLKDNLPEWDNLPSGTRFELHVENIPTVIFTYDPARSMNELLAARKAGKKIEARVNSEWVPCTFSSPHIWTLSRGSYRVAPKYAEEIFTETLEAATFAGKLQKLRAKKPKWNEYSEKLVTKE